MKAIFHLKGSTVIVEEVSQPREGVAVRQYIRSPARQVNKWLFESKVFHWNNAVVFVGNIAKSDHIGRRGDI